MLCLQFGFIIPLISGIDSQVNSSPLLPRLRGREDEVYSRHTSARSCAQN